MTPPEPKGSLRRTAAARAIRVLRMLACLGVTARVVGSLADGRFDERSDIDLLVLDCPQALRYAIEGRIEDLMGDIRFDVVYRDEARPAVLEGMGLVALDAVGLLRLVRTAPQAVVQYGLPDDPLGVDTSRPFLEVASEIAERALSKRCKDAIQAEIEQVERRWGLRR